MILKVLGLKVGSKNRSKIDQKMESKMECLLASIFNQFLIDFGGFLEARWDGKSIKNRSKKAPKNRCQKEGDEIGKNKHLEAS